MRQVLVLVLCFAVLAAAVDVRSLRKVKAGTKRHHAHATHAAAQVNWDAFPVLAGGNLAVKYASRFTDNTPGTQPVDFGAPGAANVQTVHFIYSYLMNIHQVTFQIRSAEHPNSADTDKQCLSGNVATINGVTSGHLAWIRGADNGQLTCPDLVAERMMAFYDGVVVGFGGTASELVDGMQINCKGADNARRNMYYKILKPISSTAGACSYYERYHYALVPSGQCTADGLAAARAQLRAVTLKAVADANLFVKEVVAQSTNDYDAVKDQPFAAWFGRYVTLQRNEANADKKQVMCDIEKKIYDLFEKVGDHKVGQASADSVTYIMTCSTMSRNY